MKIETVKTANDGWHVNNKYYVPDVDNNRHAIMVRKWIEEGNVPEPADPPSEPPTNAELVDMAGPVMVAYLKAEAKRLNISLAQIRNAIVDEM